jgi:2-dehydro-3-deoxygluconokinase
MRFLAIGECMAEMSPSDAPDTYRMGFAGDTFNTAWYMARVAPQVSASYLTAVGDDTVSQNLMDFMQASGVNTRAVQTKADKTIGLYLISLDNGERSFSYWRGQSAARGLADDPDVLTQAMSDADLIYFSGITLAILAPEKRAALLAALSEARTAGKVIAFDPNLRPKLWESPTVMTEAIMQGAAVCDIALPSFEDEASWFADDTPKATAQRYLRAGAFTVVVKNGSAPVLYAEADKFGEVPVTPLDQVADTTAAGDSFNAGFFAGHATGLSLTDGISYACALSREVVQHKGALVDAVLPTLPKG